MRRIERLGPLESPIFAMNLSFEWISLNLLLSSAGPFLTTFGVTFECRKSIRHCRSVLSHLPFRVGTAIYLLLTCRTDTKMPSRPETICVPIAWRFLRRRFGRTQIFNTKSTCAMPMKIRAYTKVAVSRAVCLEGSMRSAQM
jgi:hypothetical protein